MKQLFGKEKEEKENELRDLALIKTVDSIFTKEETTSILVGVLLEQFNGSHYKCVMFLDKMREAFKRH